MQSKLNRTCYNNTTNYAFYTVSTVLNGVMSLCRKYIERHGWEETKETGKKRLNLEAQVLADLMTNVDKRPIFS